MNSPILIVEDDADLRSALREMFETCLGAKLICASGLDEVVEQKELALKSQLAIIDINLGHGMPSGIDVYEWLKSHHYSQKIVFLTGHAKDHPLVVQAQKVSGVDVYVKPLTFEQILALGESK